MVFILILVSFFGGYSLIKEKVLSLDNVIKSFEVGSCFLICIYEVLYLLFFALNATLSSLNTLFLIIVVVVCILGIIKLIKNIKSLSLKIDYKYCLFYKACILIAIIAFYIFFRKYCFIYGFASDEQTYSTMTSMSLFLNKIVSSGSNTVDLNYSAHRSLCCWEMMLSVPTWLFGINLSEVLHYYIPLYWLIAIFGIFYLFGKLFFSKDDVRYCFILFCLLLIWFGFYNWTSISAQILSTGWYGRSILFSTIVPLSTYYIIENYCRYSKYNIIYILIIIFAGCSLSMTGMMTLGFMIGLMFLSSLILKDIEKSFIILIYEIPPVLFAIVYLLS